MQNYYVNTNAQANGDHEVHTQNCMYLPNILNRRHLGVFDNCADAVREAKKIYNQVDGCYFCSRACHKQ